MSKEKIMREKGETIYFRREKDHLIVRRLPGNVHSYF
jgi:hypothetical protein